MSNSEPFPQVSLMLLAPYTTTTPTSNQPTNFLVALLVRDMTSSSYFRVHSLERMFVGMCVADYDARGYKQDMN